MKLRDFPLWADENLDPDVVAHLRRLGFDVLDVAESDLRGGADADLLRLAAAQGRVVVTHDADFGTLAIHQGESMVGIIYLRPGHIDPQFTLETIEHVLRNDPDLNPPFVLVAKRSGRRVTIRVRHPDPMQ